MKRAYVFGSVIAVSIMIEHGLFLLKGFLAHRTGENLHVDLLKRTSQNFGKKERKKSNLLNVDLEQVSLAERTHSHLSDIDQCVSLFTVNGE